jgi:hypothetical protein
MRTFKWGTFTLSLVLSAAGLGCLWQNQQAPPKTVEESPKPSAAPTPVVKVLTDVEEKNVLDEIYEGKEPGLDTSTTILALSATLEKLSATQTIALIERCQAEPESRRQRVLRRALLEHLLVLDPASALRIACSFGPKAMDDLLPPLLAEWKQQDPTAAANWSEQTRKTMPGDYTQLGKVFATAKRSSGPPPQPSTAQEWAAAISQPANLVSTGGRVDKLQLCHQWAGQNWKEFAQWAVDHPQPGLENVLERTPTIYSIVACPSLLMLDFSRSS